MKLVFSLLLILTFFSQKSFGKEVKNSTQFTIFSGDKKAGFYAVAQGICNVFNRHYLNHGYECLAQESSGSAANLNLLAKGEADIAVIKPATFNKFFIKNSEQLQNKTDFVTAIHDEYLTILVQKELAIKSLADLSHKVVNIGTIGSTSELVVKKYFSDFAIMPKKIVNFGAEKSFKMLCDKKIDAWVYFIGHPNRGYSEVLKKCDLELIALSQNEISNFLKIAPFLKRTNLPKNYNINQQSYLASVSSETVLSSRRGFDPKIIELVRDILSHNKEELIKEDGIFESF